MYCGCTQAKKAEVPSHQEHIDSPLQIKLVKMLGLKNYILDKFVFRRKESSYFIRNTQGRNLIYLDQERYFSPPRYQQQIQILEAPSHSIPVVRIFPSDPKEGQLLPCIIYAHGNSSDMGDSLYFISKMANKFRAEWVVFDYTGYGESRLKEVGEEIICKDLQLVLAWVNRPIENIVLWGFSLGSFPVVYNSAKYPVPACILQCPIGSLSCMFYDQYAVNIKFKEDHFANIDYITKINGKILMMHSTADEIIPIQQARLMYKKVILERGDDNMEFIEVQKIRHNQFHRYISAHCANDLQNQVLHFLEKVRAEMQIPKGLKETSQQLQTQLSVHVPLPKELQQLQQELKETKIITNYFNQTEFQIVEQEELIPSKCRPTVNSGDVMCCAARK